MKLSTGLPLFMLLARNNIAQGTTFVNDAFTTATNVTSHAMLATDVKEMKEALSQQNYATAKSIYQNGKNSQKYDKDGNPTVLRTLQGFSTAATTGKFDLEPAFWYHVWGLSGGDYTNFDSFKTYADDYVSKLLSDGTTGTLAAEAVVALNMWMYVAHELYDGLDDCRRAEAGQNPDGLSDNGLGVKAVDEAVAFYIGVDQGSQVGSGYSLWNLALEAESEFGISSDSAAVANRKFMEGYNRYTLALSQDKRCEPGSGTTKKLHGTTNEMISAMSIPLMQKLINALYSDNEDEIKLYALAIVPQISACKPSAAEELMERLYYPYTYTKSDQATVVGLLQSAYDCLGFSCKDIGAFKTNVIGQCSDASVDLPLAGYSPQADVRGLAKIDLDILQIKILTRYSAWTPAKELYEYGKNSIISKEDGVIMYETLQNMATHKSREAADPFYGLFKAYNGSPDYAADVVEAALAGSGKYTYDLQRGEFVFKTLEYQVAYMYGIAQLYSAYDLCKATQDSADVVESWDRGIASLIGSLEGPKEGGAPTSDGMLMYNLANKRCDQFGTCDGNGIAQIIPKFMEAFNNGQAAAKTGECDKIKTTADNIAKITLAPALQGVMRYGLKNGSASSDSKDLAEGEVFTTSVLPIIKEYNAAAEMVLKKNMIIGSGKAVSDGSQMVAAAVGASAPAFGVQCADLGAASGADPCDTASLATPSSGASNNVVNVVVSALVLAFASVFL